jgi:hypothetical protein
MGRGRRTFGFAKYCLHHLVSLDVFAVPPLRWAPWFAVSAQAHFACRHLLKLPVLQASPFVVCALCRIWASFNFLNLAHTRGQANAVFDVRGSGCTAW